MKKKKFALVFDVDYTLIDGYHPTIILERRNVDVKEFWRKVTEVQQKEKTQNKGTSVDIAYLAYFMHEVRYGKLKDLTIQEIKDCGLNLKQILYPGIPDFFDNLREENPNLEIHYNIVSVGIEPMLRGSVFGRYMDRIFGYTFFDNLTPGLGIDEIKTTSSTAEKIPSIVAISCGNAETGFEFPIKKMLYFGDGETDRPAFKFVKKRQGTAICVYDPRRGGALEKAMQLRDDVNYVVPADYTKGSELWKIINLVLNK